MKASLNSKSFAVLLLISSALVQSAQADQVFSYTEAFTSPFDSQSTLVLSGTFSESDSGALTSLSSSILQNGAHAMVFNVDSMSSGRFISLPSALVGGVAFQVNGYFIGPSGNRNSITSCGQVFLDGGGCAVWQSRDPSVPSQGLTDIRTFGADIGGAWLSADTFAQTGALQLSAVPEPATQGLVVAGLALLAFRRRHIQQ